MLKLGVDNLLDNRLNLIKGRPIGLVSSVNCVDRNLRTTADRLFRHPDVKLKAMFGPEHGFRGAAQAGDKVTTRLDPVYGIPTYSLYGESYRPRLEMVRGLEALLIDLPDAGVRFFTYLSTLGHVLEAANEYGLPVIVLDRPAPITGSRVEGPLLNPKFRSFVGQYAIPIRHGMTLGELALWIRQTHRLEGDLTVIPMTGWQREWWFDQTGLPFVPPSPNLPTLNALTVYPGTCLIEGTTLSEGRGTTRPFEYIGAPWLTEPDALADHLNALEVPGAQFRPLFFTPMFSKHQAQVCGGVQVYVTDRDAFRPIETALTLMAAVKEMAPNQFAWHRWAADGSLPIDLLTGGSQVRQHLDGRYPLPALFSSWEADLREFETSRERCLLY
jgi:uncharacterized protein YbbC (DUF1343 family)